MWIAKWDYMSARRTWDWKEITVTADVVLEKRFVNYSHSPLLQVAPLKESDEHEGVTVGAGRR